MKRNDLFAAAMLMFSVLACVIPGAGQPAPLDPGMLPTMVVLTANAAMTQTAAVIPPPSLETPMPTPAPTEAFTATPKISLAGTSLILREDQSAVFIDHKAGIELEIPAGWMAVRLNEPEYYAAFTSPAASDPEILEHWTLVQSVNPDHFRLDAIDIRPGHVINGAVSYINVVFDPDDFRSLEELAETEKKDTKPFVNFEFISSDIRQIANGMRVLVIEQRWDASPEVVYYRGVFFRVPSGALLLAFFTTLSLKETVLPEFDQIVNSVTLINP